MMDTKRRTTMCAFSETKGQAERDLPRRRTQSCVRNEVNMSRMIQTKTGLLEGVSKQGYTAYLGIPYAEPPIGENRWKAPVPKKNWEGVRKADAFGNIPPQRLPSGNEPWGAMYYKEFYAYPEFLREQSEDCLYLNIWVPEEAEEQKLPVAFWIHGGGFSGGYSSEIEFDGEEYTKRGVILVTVEYRLGILGFLAHPWLDEENEQHISGNYGILDQIEALRWVYENIEAFGGDPQNITVFGQSAGSMSTQVLVSSNLTEGMIAKAILQSGMSCEDHILYEPTLEEEEEIGKLFVKLAGVDSLEELRSLSCQQILDIHDRLNVKTFPMGKGLVVVPNADGYVLKKTVSGVWQDGTMKQIPYMAGCVNDDLGSSPEEIREKKPGRLLAECIRWSKRTEETFGKPAYVYYFAHDLPGDDNGAFHSSELWYTFGTLKRWWRPGTEADQKLSEQMLDFWTSFMKNGKPGDGQTWSPCTIEDPFVLRFV